MYHVISLWNGIKINLVLNKAVGLATKKPSSKWQIRKLRNAKNDILGMGFN